MFVEKKVPKSQLKPSDVIPDKVGGHKTDVVGRTGEISAQTTRRVRPIPGGYSCGHIRVTAGTMGGWFVDRDGDVVGLSNNHVLANENKAVIAGQYYRGKRRVGDATVQPGVYDNRRWRHNMVGNLKSFVKLNSADNLQDSAIFKPYRRALVESRIQGVGQLSGFRDDLAVGETVQKVGRTTGHTVGRVIATDGVVNVRYGPRLGVIEFEDQIITDHMSEGGDSGSLLLDMSNNVVGLLFAGSSSVTIHNKIKYPREQWGLQVYDPSPLTETFSSTLTVDGVDEVSSSMGDLNSLVAKARKLARGGKSVSLNISFSAD